MRKCFRILKSSTPSMDITLKAQADSDIKLTLYLHFFAEIYCSVKVKLDI